MEAEIWEGAGSDTEIMEEERAAAAAEDDEETELLRDRFRLSALSIIGSEAEKNGMEIPEPIVSCISDLAFKYAEQLAKDLEKFAHHAGRKHVNMEDVVLSAHRNEHLSVSLRSFANDLKAKEPQSERKRRKAPRRDDKVAADSITIS